MKADENPSRKWFENTLIGVDEHEKTDILLRLPAAKNAGPVMNAQAAL